MIRQAPCSENSSAGQRTATTTRSRSSSRAHGAYPRWPSPSSTTSTGWLPDACRSDITGTLVCSETVLDQTVGASQGYHVVATATDTGQIAWSDGAYSVIEAIDRATFVDTGKGTVFASIAHEDSGNTCSPEG